MHLRNMGIRTGLVTLLILGSFATPAHAYIDGGSATVLFQALLAGAATAGLSLRLGWRRLTGRELRSQDGEPASDDRD